MSLGGFVKIHRKIQSWRYKKDPNMVALWVDLLLRASYDNNYDGLGNKLGAGQLSTGRKQLAESTGLSERTVRTCLDRLKIDQQINQQTTNRCSIITISNWSDYQNSDQQIDHQTTSNRPHLKKEKKDKKYKKNIYSGVAKKVLEFLNQESGKSFQPVESTLRHIIARLSEGYTTDDLSAVISWKLQDEFFIKDDKKFIRPSTLFNATNFPNYLEEVKTYERTDNS